MLNFFKRFFSRDSLYLFRLRFLTRASMANVLMVLFILLTSVGTSLISPPVGLIVAGITCGIFGYILGLD